MGLDPKTLSRFLNTRPIPRLRRKATVRPSTARVDAAMNKTLLLISGLMLVSEANEHLHWRVRQKRAKAQRGVVALHLSCHTFPVLPLRCLIVRIAPREIDSDNAWGSAKHARDEIAAHFGVNDRDETKIKWDVAQEKGPYGVRVEISAMRP